MGRLRYQINVTLDGCVDHAALEGTQEMHDVAADSLGRADALLFGRVTYQMMESAWRRSSPEEYDDPFVKVINELPKHVVSSTLESVGWNSTLLRGDLVQGVRELKESTDGELLTGGVTVPRVLAAAGLIDAYEFVVHPVVAGHGPRLLDGVRLDLETVARTPLESGATLLSLVPR
ncbi:MAG: dihydrofolate reductase family protein [Nocardioides sp.]|jgi:dihydrofolate reductase